MHACARCACMGMHTALVETHVGAEAGTMFSAAVDAVTKGLQQLQAAVHRVLSSNVTSKLMTNANRTYSVGYRAIGL